MATMTAPPGVQGDGPEFRPEETPARSLWQAPVFVLGVAALVAVWFCRPLFPESPAARLARDLASARQLLSRADGDANQALEILNGTLDNTQATPEFAGEPAYLIGWAHVRLAEQTDDPARAREGWMQAKQFLAQAESAGVPEDDQPNLGYRLGKVGFHLGDNPRVVVNYLEACAGQSDNRPDAYNLLQQAYLRLPKPELEKAYAANQAWRNLPETSEDDLALAKLFGGEILLRMNKREEARESLQMINEQTAPPAIVVRARLLRARSHQEEREPEGYARAANLYKAALLDARAPVPQTDLPFVHYNLGICNAELKHPEEASSHWEKCLSLSRGEEGQAAALQLADLRLQEGALEPACRMLAKAVERTAAPAGWKNTLVHLNGARAKFDKAIQAFRQGNRHDLAVQAVGSYGRLIAPRRVLELQGEITAEWARVKLEPAAGAAPSDEQQRQAKELFRQAGEAHAKLAELPEVAAAQRSDHLWTSAQNFLAGGFNEQALARMQNLVKLEAGANRPGAVNRLGEAYYRLGEVHKALGHPAEEVASYRKCMEYDTRFAYRARYQLAMIALADKKVDEAEAALDLNIKLLRWDSDPEALSQSLYALGNLRYQQRHWRGVIPLLENAIGRFKENPDLTRARFQLADSYRQLAAQETLTFLIGENMSQEKRSHFIKEHRRWLEKAAAEFAKLNTFLETPEGKTHLTAEQRTQVPFITAKCWYNLGQNEKALELYEKLIERHAGKPEGLEALGGAVSCHAALGQVPKLQQRLIEIGKVLPTMDPEIREPWEKWLAEATKQLRGI